MIQVRTGSREGVFDITGQCADFASRAAGGGDGLLHVFVPHATAGLALIELGASSGRDLLAVLDNFLPADDRDRGVRRRPGQTHPGRSARTNCCPNGPWTATPTPGPSW